MSTVWVICETVDLGYHMVEGYASYDRAVVEYNRMVAEAKAEKIRDLIEYCGYTQHSAEYHAHSQSYYELQQLKVQE